MLKILKTLGYLREKNNPERGEKMRIEGTTNKMMNFLKKNGINLSELSRIAGIPYKLLYASVRDKNRKRELRADEFLSICEALEVDPGIFAKERSTK